MEYQDLPLDHAFLEIEEGPVVLVTATDGKEADVCAISWIMPLGFSPDDCNIALCTGNWNHTIELARKSQECCICVPTEKMMEKTIKAGSLNGKTVEKFKSLSLKTEPGVKVRAPHILGCSSFIECEVIDYISVYSLLILRPLKAGKNPDRSQERKFHARGDGHFYLDGEERDYSEIMGDKIPEGVRKK
jgi:flavin reductase (DIM6/NTAB) family NADH-FMN oxidoreductase RutF